MELKSGDVELRSLLESDAPRLAELANNEKIGLNLRDGFPYPYTREDASLFIKRFMHVRSFFAILYKGEYVGNISLYAIMYMQIGASGFSSVNLIGIKSQLRKRSRYQFYRLGFARIPPGVYACGWF
jgi:hypothetical protein